MTRELSAMTVSQMDTPAAYRAPWLYRTRRMETVPRSRAALNEPCNRLPVTQVRIRYSPIPKPKGLLAASATLPLASSWGERVALYTKGMTTKKRPVKSAW